MAEWIEILKNRRIGLLFSSPLAMAEWIEIQLLLISQLLRRSPLAMAEWIEIQLLRVLVADLFVSASDGGVD